MDYYNPYMTQAQQPYATQMLQRQRIVQVNGRQGADAYQIGPDSQALLLDTHDPIVWLIQTDGAGYKTVTPYDIVEHKEVNQTIVLQNLETRIHTLEEKIEGMINGKSNFTETQSESTTNTRNTKK
nr:hypothetical protein [uncultured Lachnoclostridium sp.]